MEGRKVGGIISTIIGVIGAFYAASTMISDMDAYDHSLWGGYNYIIH